MKTKYTATEENISLNLYLQLVSSTELLTLRFVTT